MAAVLRTTFSNSFSWMKIFEFRLKFRRNMFPGVQLTISEHWFRWWLGAEQETSHYLKQWWPSSTTHICVIRPQWVKRKDFALKWFKKETFVLLMLRNQNAILKIQHATQTVFIKMRNSGIVGIWHHVMRPHLPPQQKPSITSFSCRLRYFLFRC